MKNKLLNTLFITILFGTSYAQTAEEFFKSGAKEYIEDDWFKALDITETGLQKYPEDLKLRLLKKAILREKDQQEQQSKPDNQKKEEDQQNQNDDNEDDNSNEESKQQNGQEKDDQISGQAKGTPKNGEGDEDSDFEKKQMELKLRRLQSFENKRIKEQLEEKTQQKNAGSNSNKDW